ncbi:interferon-induced protein 44-like, partial [Mercenaria mercenaria]|uniref:interferon-induced protein 44-like n=1 Tax=Mercenaria mercenaria TaxID=6596 RepID=UPI00234F7E2E
LTKYTPHKKLKNFRLFDTVGLGKSYRQGFYLKPVLKVVKGDIRPEDKFKPSTPIHEGSKEFRSDPYRKRRFHCVVFVCDANVIGPDNISRTKIKDLKHELQSLDIPVIVLLTKIDVLCELVEEDIENTYRSRKVKEAVLLAQELFDVPKQNIFPVTNYKAEMKMDVKNDILSLLALRQMISIGRDPFLRKKVPKKISRRNRNETPLLLL